MEVENEDSVRECVVHRFRGVQLFRRDRAGYLQKLSRKGWLCKTFEGELAMTTVPGVAPTLWNFTVWDDDVAKKTRPADGKMGRLH